MGYHATIVHLKTQKEQVASSLPCLWVPEELREFIPHLAKHFHVNTPETKPTPGDHIIALKDECSTRRVLRQLQATPEVDIRIFPAELLLFESLDGLMMKAQPADRWLEIMNGSPLELSDAVALAEDLLKMEPDQVQLNLDLDRLRQRVTLAQGREMSSWEWNKKYVEPLKAKLEKDFQLPAFGGGDGGDGGGKLIKHPAFSSVSAQEIEARLNALAQEGLTGSSLTGRLNDIASETGRYAPELRKQYQELLLEIEQEELREDTTQQVDLLLEASTASVDLHSVLPSSLATPLVKLASWLNLKPECYLTTLLTTVSILHKASTRVILNKEWDFDVSPNLNSAIISDSSQKKSPILKAICKKPLSVLQREALEEYKIQMLIYEEELREWEKIKPEDRGSAPEKPERKIYFFTKTTGEGLTYQAARCPDQGMLYLSDELAGMLNSQNQYRGGKGSDKQDLLTYYDGSADTVLRAEGIKSEADFILLGITGGIQPKVIQKLLDDCSDADGGWARFIFVNQPNAASEMRADGGSYDLTELLADLYRKVDELPARTYRLSPKAFKLFCNSYNRLEQLRVSERLEGMKSVWGKSEGRIGKLAVNLHVISSLMNGQTPSEEIPEEIVRAALKLTKYYAQQVQSLYTQFSDPDSIAPHLTNVIQMAQRKDDWLKASDVYLSITKKHRPSGETVRQWFGELVLMGKGEVRGSGRSLQFRVFSDKNPPPTLPPEGSKTKLDDLRQELDELSNSETTTNQEVQEFLDKLDNLDDFPKNEIATLTGVNEGLLEDKVTELGIQEEEENQFLGELSNLSKNSQEVELVSDAALDDFLDKSSNLDVAPQSGDVTDPPTPDIEIAPQTIKAGDFVRPLPETSADRILKQWAQQKAYSRDIWEVVEAARCTSRHFLKPPLLLYVRPLGSADTMCPIVHAEECELVRTEETPLQVGDRVIWDECPAHCADLGPFELTAIDGDYGKLDLFSKLVPLSELTKI